VIFSFIEEQSRLAVTLICQTFSVSTSGVLPWLLVPRASGAPAREDHPGRVRTIHAECQSALWQSAHPRPNLLAREVVRPRHLVAKLITTKPTFTATTARNSATPRTPKHALRCGQRAKRQFNPSKPKRGLAWRHHL